MTENDTVISIHSNIPAFLSSVLQVLPDTKTIAVVIGASPLEKFWLDELKKETKVFENRVKFVWYSDLSFEEILRQASMLPPHAVIFWHVLAVDGAGVVHEGDGSLRRLRSVANAPIFSYQEAYFGRYTVGGPMHSIAELSRLSAQAATRILGGESPGSIKVQPTEFAAPKYDWRELQRWNISESNLPSGSNIVFREPSLWESHRWEAILIAGRSHAQGLVAESS